MKNLIPIILSLCLFPSLAYCNKVNSNALKNKIVAVDNTITSEHDFFKEKKISERIYFIGCSMLVKDKYIPFKNIINFSLRQGFTGKEKSLQLTVYTAEEPEKIIVDNSLTTNEEIIKEILYRQEVCSGVLPLK